jgi:hypothetical protein
MEFFLHIGGSKTISSQGLIGIFSKNSILECELNEDVFPEVFDEDEEEKFVNSRSILLYEDGYLVPSIIKPETLVARRRRFKQAMYLNIATIK